MILISPDGTTAFDSTKFHHAYIWKNELSNSVCLKVILYGGQEVWWDSSPLICEPAKHDMIASLNMLCVDIDWVLISQDRLSAFSYDAFSHARIQGNKENFSWEARVVLDDDTGLLWDEIGAEQSEDEMKPILAELIAMLNEER